MTYFVILCFRELGKVSVSLDSVWYSSMCPTDHFLSFIAIGDCGRWGGEGVKLQISFFSFHFQVCSQAKRQLFPSPNIISAIFTEETLKFFLISVFFQLNVIYCCKLDFSILAYLHLTA